MALEEDRMTYHTKAGRFTSAGGAHTVTRGGQRFLMVRSLRPMKTAARAEPVPAADAEVSQGEPTQADVAEAISRAKAKAILASLLTASPGWIPLHECVSMATGKHSIQEDAVGNIMKAFKDDHPKHVTGKSYPQAKQPEFMKWLKSKTVDKRTAEEVWGLLFKGFEYDVFDRLWAR